MRVLFLAPHPFFQPRGTPIADRAVIEVLSRRGDHVDVVTFHEGERVRIPNVWLYRIPRVPGIRGIRPGFSFKKLLCDFFLLARAVQLMRRNKYHVVHAVEESALIALVLKAVFGIPFVFDMDSSMPEQITERMTWLRPMRPLFDAIEAFLIRQSAGVMAVCQSLAAKALLRGSLVGKVEDVSLVQEAPQTRADEILRTTIGQPGPVVMYVGNLEPYQGIDLLLESFVTVVARVPDANLVIIGGARQHILGYQQKAELLGIGARVHFIGPRPLDSLGWYLRQADVVVSPRIQGTNTPMKVFSYLDCGRPLVATRLATHLQVLDDTIARLAMPAPLPFGSAIAELLLDPEAGRRLAQRARDRVRREFSPEAYQAKVNTFYDAVQRKLDPGRMPPLVVGPAVVSSPAMVPVASVLTAARERRVAVEESRIGS